MTPPGVSVWVSTAEGYGPPISVRVPHEDLIEVGDELLLRVKRKRETAPTVEELQERLEAIVRYSEVVFFAGEERREIKRLAAGDPA